jgi:hypothetical protein
MPIMKLYTLQFILCFSCIILILFGFHQDIFNTTEAILGFIVSMGGFIHAGYHMILED